MKLCCLKRKTKAEEKKPEKNTLRFIETGSHSVALVGLGFAMEISLSASASSTGD